MTAAALAALSAGAAAQDSQTWQDATVSPTAEAAEATSTITKTLSIVHTETVWGQSANSSSTTWAASSQTSVPVEATSAEPSAAPIATPSVDQAAGVNGAAALSFDVMLAVVAAGAVTFWSS